MPRQPTEQQRQAAQRKYEAERDRLLHKIHDQIDKHPSLAHLREITPPRPAGCGSAHGGCAPAEGGCGSRSDEPRLAIDAPRDPGHDNHRACEFFAKDAAAVNAGQTSGLPSSTAIFSPPAQDAASNGEIITPSAASVASAAEPAAATQVSGGMALSSTPLGDLPVAGTGPGAGIIRHGAAERGEIIDLAHQTQRGEGACATRSEPQNRELVTRTTPTILADVDGGDDQPLDPGQIPARAVRRGRPVALDDLAKGRLLGLMAYGLSFRQAAAQLGIHHQTILNTMRRDEEFAQQVSEARLDAISQHLLAVVKASRTSWRAAAWLANYLNERRIRTYEDTPEERELERRTRS